MTELTADAHALQFIGKFVFKKSMTDAEAEINFASRNNHVLAPAEPTVGVSLTGTYSGVPNGRAPPNSGNIG